MCRQVGPWQLARVGSPPVVGVGIEHAEGVWARYIASSPEGLQPPRVVARATASHAGGSGAAVTTTLHGRGGGSRHCAGRQPRLRAPTTSEAERERCERRNGERAGGSEGGEFQWGSSILGNSEEKAWFRQALEREGPAGRSERGVRMALLSPLTPSLQQELPGGSHKYSPPCTRWSSTTVDSGGGGPGCRACAPGSAEDQRGSRGREGVKI